jgi:tRNA dimethylallyltransferase
LSTDLFAQNCWFLTGATAVGKTAVGLALAEALGAEIVSLDSMAIYRGMDIGTAKPTAPEQARVRHHLIDIAEPEDEFSVAQYLEAADGAISDIRKRGREALFVGGTPLYLKAIGGEALHERLAQVDPVAASLIHPNDTRRLVRALEVYRATGQPISHQQMEFDEGRPAENCRVFVLRRSRDEQHARIEARVEEMIERGFVEEVRRLTSGGRRLGRTAAQAVGYREVSEHLAGQFDHATMVARIKTRTRQFAKRQGVWFRSLSECRFVDVAGDARPQAVAEEIAAAGS